jgi:hypothetical protein
MSGFRTRLSVGERDPNYEYRWINDDKSRVSALTKQDDWDVVQSDEEESHTGASTVTRQVGTKASGEPLMAYLVRKPKKYADEDRAKRQAALDEQMSAIGQSKRGDAIQMGGGPGYVATDTQLKDGRRS